MQTSYNLTVNRLTSSYILAVTGYGTAASFTALMCVSLLSRLLITSGVIWIPYDWLNKFHNFYMAAIVGIISRRGLRIKACHQNQPYNSKLALYKPLLNSCLNSCISVRGHSTLVIKLVVSCVSVVCISMCLKRAGLATYKQFRVISNKTLFKKLCH